jgi:sugar phosphate isomerase/epimerase
MKISRRQWFASSTLLLSSCALLPSTTSSAQSPGAARSKAVRSPMRIGTVTYNLGKDWDVETLIRNCEAARFEGVELRTTHKHGVEVNLTKPQRQDVKKRFRDSNVELMGLGSAFDYHTPDPSKLRKDIEATKEYIVLAHDVGASGVKVRPNGLPKEVPVEKTLEQIGKSLRELGQFADGYGQQIRLEVHGTGTSLLPNIKRMIEVADHSAVGVCWNSNQTDLDGEGFDHNFNLVKDKIFTVHMRDLFLEEYPFRKLLTRLTEIGYTGYCLAEIPESTDPVRVMRYYRALWLAYQGLL